MADQTGDGTDRGERNSLDLDALAVSDRFRLFNFTRRDDHVAYLWVLRALDRLRGVHQVQAHTDDVAAALAELGTVYAEVPRLDGLREKLDAPPAPILLASLATQSHGFRSDRRGQSRALWALIAES